MNDQLYMVKIVHSSETIICKKPFAEELNNDDHVIIPTRYGNDLGSVLGECRCGARDKDEEIESIIRIASDEDMAKHQKNLEREKEALFICKEKVANHKLDMKLVSAHYLVDEPKVLFFFTADSRVDFRDLVKDLVAVFKMRIELRQIGVRDESRVLGGMAVCGRMYCCHGVTDKLKPVSIKMAKEQNLSLNSMKISGPCGRLLCCLAYEYDFYHEEKRNLPSEGGKVAVGDELFKITEVNILTKKIYLSAPDGRVLTVPLCKLTKSDDNSRWRVSTEVLDA